MKIMSKTRNCSVTEYREHEEKIGGLAEANPDLTYDFIRDILIAQQEAQA